MDRASCCSNQVEFGCSVSDPGDRTRARVQDQVRTSPQPAFDYALCRREDHDDGFGCEHARAGRLRENT
jgi:hypothetical protein